jgi:hypothetical protein
MFVLFMDVEVPPFRCYDVASTAAGAPRYGPRNVLNAANSSELLERVSVPVMVRSP